MTSLLYRARFFVVTMIAAALLAACGGSAAAPTVDVDAAVQTALAATRQVEQQVNAAVQATLTAQAAGQPTATSAVAAVPTATPAASTDTPAPAATATTAPTNTPAPAPIATPIRILESDVDGNDGNDFLRSSSNSNNGRVVLLPGFDPADLTDTPTFRGSINLRVEVFDTRAGLYDGAGIESVTFRIIADDGGGDVVWEKKEVNPAFCLFGGDEPTCSPITLDSNARWPSPFDGKINNNVYLAEITIVPVQGDVTTWRWRFFIESPALAAAPVDNTARIDRIDLQNGRYWVYFETFGFTPQLPGQHVHFFFDSVPPDQAGAPGSGPWQLYPASPGAANTSPFKLLGVSDRPASASQMCILVANADHSVNQGTGNCVDLP